MYACSCISVMTSHNKHVTDNVTCYPRAEPRHDIGMFPLTFCTPRDPISDTA